MGTEHRLISLLAQCLAQAPSLKDHPVGERAHEAICRFEEARALGFESISQMEEHQAWLQKNGTAEYRRWLGTVLPAEAPAANLTFTPVRSACEKTDILRPTGPLFDA